MSVTLLETVTTISVVEESGGVSLIETVIQGPPGATGAAGPGVPTGGTAAQRLKKLSATDYDTGWGAPAQVHGYIPVPVGGDVIPVTGAGLVGSLSLTKLRLVCAADSGAVNALKNGGAVAGWSSVTIDGTVREYTPTTSPLVLVDGDVLSIQLKAGSGPVTGMSFAFSE